MSQPLKYVYKGLRYLVNDDLEREEFKKRKRGRIFDFKKIKYYITIQTPNNWEQSLIPIIQVPLNQKDCVKYEEFKAWPVMWKILSGNLIQEIEYPHYEKQVEVIQRYNYATKTQIKFHIIFILSMSNQPLQS
jgi:hypothetical protein